MNAATQFFEANAPLKKLLPQIPTDLYTDEEITRWIFKQDIPYIELDLTFDVTQWRAESKIAEPYLVNHRESQPHKGWKSCCIHGIDIDKTGIWHCYAETEPEYHWTDLSASTPHIKQFWQQFPFERFARVRFMQLEAGGYIYPHQDAPPGYDKDFELLDHLVPINIAIDHPEECYMTLKDHGIVPWKSGNIKLVNITNYHSVINFSDRHRMHLIAHGIVGNRFKEFSTLIANSYKKQYERSRI
jgi:hypothetical protein